MSFRRFRGADEAPIDLAASVQLLQDNEWTFTLDRESQLDEATMVRCGAEDGRPKTSRATARSPASKLCSRHHYGRRSPHYAHHARTASNDVRLRSHYYAQSTVIKTRMPTRLSASRPRTRSCSTARVLHCLRTRTLACVASLKCIILARLMLQSRQNPLKLPNPFFSSTSYARNQYWRLYIPS